VICNWDYYRIDEKGIAIMKKKVTGRRRVMSRKILFRKSIVMNISGGIVGLFEVCVKKTG